MPLNTSTVADIQSMFVYNHYLVWLTTSGHVRMVSLITYEVRYVFWLDEPLRAIRLVSFGQWPTPTTTIATTMKVTTTTTVTDISTTSQSTSTSTATSSTTSKQSNGTIDTTTITDYDNESSPWKATTYVTSVILGIALFFCAAMIACVLLNHRLGRAVPHSFTNIFHVLRQRIGTSQVETEDETLTTSSI